jgi:universal stress protein E
MPALVRPFKRFLVHVDVTASAQPALQRVFQLTKGTRAQVRLVDVIPSDITRTPLRGLVKGVVRDTLADFVAEARRRGLRATSATLQGDPATSLIAEAVSWRADVLLRSHSVRRGPVQPAGPIDAEVLRRCPCPVWIVTPRQAKGEGVIVAAVDPEPSDPARHDLSLRVAAAAAQLSEARGVTLHLVHAWNAFGHQILASHATKEQLQEHYEACSNHAKARFEALVSGLELPKGTQTHLLEGASDKVIARFVERRKASLVVMGTVGRTGLAGLVMGNTAERVLRQVRCSVLAFKPTGFAAQSPEVP